MVNNAWQKGNNGIIDNLSKVKTESIAFNLNTFGNIFFRKQKLEARLHGIQISLEEGDS